MPKDKFVLQNDTTGTIHQLTSGGKMTRCGIKKTESYKKRKLSKALDHSKARLCGMAPCRNAE